MSARSRLLPAELTERLSAAAQVERLATSPDQRRRAIAGTSRLLRASLEAGWRPTEVGVSIGMSRKVVAQRAASVARNFGSHPTGLVVPRPPVPEREKPLTERTWLRAGEACQLLGIAYATLAQWRQQGLTPLAELRRGRWWFAQADLQRILAAPRYRHGVDRRAVWHQIQADT